MDSQGTVKIADFGLVKSFSDPAITQAGSLLGTPHFMSPEQCRGLDADVRSDIYALGVTLYFLIVGRPPFQGDTLAVMQKHQNEAPPRIVDPGVPHAVMALIERMMSKKPADRHQTPTALVTEVEALLASETVAVAPPQQFDDRERFQIAEAAMAVIRRHAQQYADDDAVWEAFVAWRGRGDEEYLRKIRKGGKYIFYSVLHDLYDFARHVCEVDVTEEIGEQLSGALLARHLPDLLQTTLMPTGTLHEQLLWLTSRFVEATTGAIYRLSIDPPATGKPLRIVVSYRSEVQMIDYLKRSGHNPERAFASSFNVYKGALRALFGRVVHGFRPEQFHGLLRELRSEFTVAITDENRFHLENLIEILIDYVRRLRRRSAAEIRPTAEEAPCHVSKPMQKAWDSVKKAAASDEIALLCGEPGTGKSFYARIIHEISRRSRGPFVEVGLTSDIGSENMIQSNLFGHVKGAFTGAEQEKRGLFALADGGTIFLDEIGDASPECQQKLLRVVERKQFKMLGGKEDVSVDVRIIAATNKDLLQMVKEKKFREDLYYRLHVIMIYLPPLRERAEDIPALVQSLFERICLDRGKEGVRLSEQAFERIRSYSWPGNVRELENALRRALAFADGPVVEAADLPDEVGMGAAETGAAAPAPGRGDRIIDTQLLMQALGEGPAPRGRPTHLRPGHIDHARREYLRTLIEFYHGSLRDIAQHWDRVNEKTVRSAIKKLGLEEELERARGRET